MVQVTERDEALLAWLDVVRLADMDAVRWAVGGGRWAPCRVRVNRCHCAGRSSGPRG